MNINDWIALIMNMQISLLFKFRQDNLSEGVRKKIVKIRWILATGERSCRQIIKEK